MLCSAFTRAGRPCRFAARNATGLCINHDPAYRAQQRRNLLRGARNSAASRSLAGIHLQDLSLETPAEIRHALSAIFVAELRGEVVAHRSRRLIRLAAAASRNLAPSTPRTNPDAEFNSRNFFRPEPSLPPSPFARHPSDVADLTALSATALARLIANGEVSSRDVASAHLERIAGVNGELHAVIALRGEQALAEAGAADAAVAAEAPLGPLHGVPFTAKDWIETDDLPCVAGFEDRRTYVPRRDATAVARLRAAGGILLGKTKPGLEDDTHPRARNPRNPARSAGGSSGGEAAIVAACGSPLGLGSDSGGSLRWPAHCCGVATIRPTTGRVPNTGHFPRINPTADPRTAIGPIARTIDDLELALRIISGIDFFDSGVVPMPLGRSAAVDAAGLGVAWFTNFPGASPSPSVAAAVERSAAALKAAGATVTEAVPPRLEESLPLTRAYWSRPESASWSQWSGAGPSVLSADEVERSLFEWDRFRRAMLGFMREFDVVLCPVADGPAPAFDAPVPQQTWHWMLPWSLTGYPVVALPAGEEDGLPLAVQVIARPWEEHTALAAAKVIEAAR